MMQFFWEDQITEEQLEGIPDCQKDLPTFPKPQQDACSLQRFPSFSPSPAPCSAAQLDRYRGDLRVIMGLCILVLHLSVWSFIVGTHFPVISPTRCGEMTAAAALCWLQVEGGRVRGQAGQARQGRKAAGVWHRTWGLSPISSAVAQPHYSVLADEVRLLAKLGVGCFAVSL